MGILQSCWHRVELWSEANMRKLQIVAGVGNFIEWYDIGVYGYSLSP